MPPLMAYFAVKWSMVVKAVHSGVASAA